MRKRGIPKNLILSIAFHSDILAPLPHRHRTHHIDLETQELLTELFAWQASTGSAHI